jgi:hypothetical protein
METNSRQYRGAADIDNTSIYIMNLGCTKPSCHSYLRETPFVCDDVIRSLLEAGLQDGYGDTLDNYYRSSLGRGIGHSNIRLLGLSGKFVCAECRRKELISKVGPSLPWACNDPECICLDVNPRQNRRYISPCILILNIHVDGKPLQDSGHSI